MTYFPGYVKKYGKLYGLLLALIFLQSFFLLIKSVEIYDIVYYFVIEIFIVGVFTIFDYYFYRRKQKNLRSIASHPVSEQAELLLDCDINEEYLLDIVQQQSSARYATENEYQEKYSSMEQYYNMWVHQIKTPICGVNVVLQSMEPCEATNEIGDGLFKIEQYVDMALQYQRIMATENDFKFKKVSLNGIIRENIRKYARLFIAKKLSVRYEETSLSVVTDEKWLGFVMGQIITNAIKYSESGKITIEALEKEESVILNISDEGIGISEEDLPRVFERGFTGYNGRNDKSSTGIGLFLCKSIIDKLGHKIEITSKLGVGSTVSIEIKK